VNYDPFLVMILFGTPNLQMMDLMNFTANCLLILTTRVPSAPLSEFVDGDVEEPVPSDVTGKWLHVVQPPHNEGP
jgi:hypothetical protein